MVPYNKRCLAVTWGWQLGSIYYPLVLVLLVSLIPRKMLLCTDEVIVLFTAEQIVLLAGADFFNNLRNLSRTRRVKNSFPILSYMTKQHKVSHFSKSAWSLFLSSVQSNQICSPVLKWISAVLLYNAGIREPSTGRPFLTAFVKQRGRHPKRLNQWLRLQEKLKIFTPLIIFGERQCCSPFL